MPPPSAPAARSCRSLCALAALALAPAACAPATEAPLEPAAVAVAQAALNPAPALSDFVLYAERSLVLREHATVTGGDVGVHSAAGGPYPYSTHAAAVLAHAKLDPNHTLIADSVFLAKHAVLGDIQANTWIDKGSSMGCSLPSHPHRSSPYHFPSK